MSQPEAILVSQGEDTKEFYIIAKGECEVLIKDEKGQEQE